MSTVPQALAPKLPTSAAAGAGAAEGVPWYKNWKILLPIGVVGALGVGWVIFK
jgi:hypothetical protein